MTSSQKQRQLDEIEDLIIRISAASRRGWIDRHVAAELMGILAKQRQYVEEALA
jgi:hypothetical protein